MTLRTIQELAHPDGIVVLVSWEGLRGIQKVHAIAVNTVGTRLASGVATHHLQLLRQIDDGHLNIRVVTHALQGPTTCVATHVHQGLGFVGKHDFFREEAILCSLLYRINIVLLPIKMRIMTTIFSPWQQLPKNLKSEA